MFEIYQCAHSNGLWYKADFKIEVPCIYGIKGQKCSSSLLGSWVFIKKLLELIRTFLLINFLLFTVTHTIDFKILFWECVILFICWASRTFIYIVILAQLHGNIFNFIKDFYFKTFDGNFGLYSYEI